ncbi:flagellar biosynthesis protein FlhB [Pueribacillus theae]|uniref:Flagellar biosynthetic protein FlhB n=1 Tax=Pueribacillus theae TaxID=2171751 RepID=A0A2U1K8B3_9BACI|nr:flagellar biosynthesis protein FlhB [Pueribacillus theae]PWA13519.1 flagellar biosynthesis protein FlhB [Pueribacillus theae]
MPYIRIDLQFFSQEKTEKATPKKRQDERKKGRVSKSADVNTAIILFVVFLFLWFFGGFLRDELFAIFEVGLKDYILMDVTENTVHLMMSELSFQAAKVVLPILLAAIIGALLSNYMQVGFLFSTEPLVMKLERVNPIQGAKRIFSLRAIVELLKSMLKIAFIGLVTFAVLWFSKDEVFRLTSTSPATSLSVVGSLTVKMGLFASILLLFLSIFDYLYQKYDFEKNIRMSKQDIKDEYKKVEGDPLIKSKIKEKQRQMAMQRMMQEVPKADVVITNPTHYAVALKYDENEMDAPEVIAKGVDYVALKIKSIAKSNDVTIIENRSLARALYHEAEIGETIPEQLFKAVAEVLAYVYRLKEKI